MDSASSRAASLRSALQRGIWLTIILTLLCAAAGGAFGWSRQRDARAESVILLNPLDGNPFSTSGRGDSLTNLETEAQLARGNTVAEQVQRRLGTSDGPEELLSGLGVNAPTNTQLLAFTYSHPDPAEAVRRAQAFAEEFLTFRESRARNLVDGQVSLLEAQIKELQAEQAELAAKILNPKLSASEKTVLQNQLDAAATQINQLRSHRAELQIGPFDPGQLVTPAALHREGLLDSWAAFAVIGAAVGLVLSLLIAIVRARLDSRVHHVDDVILAGRSLLGEVDAVDAAEMNRTLRAPGLSEELPAGYRDLRVSLLTARHRRPLVLLAASSSNSPTQVPRFAPGLAVALAAARLRTVVVDTLGIWPLPIGTAVPDLAAHLAGDPEASETPPLVTLGEFLTLVPAGDLVAPDDVFMSPAMTQFVAGLRQSADVVMLIGGGLGGSAARALAALSDAVMTEVREGESAYRDLVVTDPLIDAKDAGVVFLRRSAGREARRRVQLEPKPGGGRRRWPLRTGRVAPGGAAHVALSRGPDEPSPLPPVEPGPPAPEEAAVADDESATTSEPDVELVEWVEQEPDEPAYDEESTPLEATGTNGGPHPADAPRLRLAEAARGGNGASPARRSSAPAPEDLTGSAQRGSRGR